MTIDVSSAFDHIQNEIGYEYITQSLKSDFDFIQRAHDAIHEFQLLAVLCVPDDKKKHEIWLKKSAFLVFEWEFYDCAHRSFIEAICSYYIEAEILLRSSLELIIKGAFWECLSHEYYRQNFGNLNKMILGNKEFLLLREYIENNPKIKDSLELNSSTIFDLMEKKIHQKRISFKKMVEQLSEWQIFLPINNQVQIIYDDIYTQLSDSIHVLPNKTDIGRRMQSEKDEVFSRATNKRQLENYLNSLCKIVDIAIVIELNIFDDVIQQYPIVQANLEERINEIKRLDLKNSLTKLNMMKR